MIIKNIILVLFAIQLFGCGNVNYKDASNQQEYKYLIGNIFKIINNSKIHGYSLNNEKIIHRYLIANQGAGNRFIFIRKILPIGTKIKIKKVMICTNCILDFKLRVKYVVDIVPTPNYIISDKEIWMDDDVLINK